jgi:hypothetical protein
MHIKQEEILKIYHVDKYYDDTGATGIIMQEKQE